MRSPSPMVLFDYRPRRGLEIMSEDVNDQLDRLERQLQWSVDNTERLKLLKEINEIEVKRYEAFE